MRSNTKQSAPNNHSGAILRIAATQKVPLKLGQGYNVRDDAAINFNVFKSELSDKDLLRVEANNSVIRLVDDVSLNDKFKALDVTGELKLSVITGIVKVEGCGRYVLEEHKESNVVAIHLTSVITTETESVDVFKDKVKKAIDGNRLTNAMDTTHVVTGIIFGGRAACSFVFRDVSDSKREEIMAKLKVKLSCLGIDIGAGGTYDSSDQDNSLTKNVDFKLDGDFLVDSALHVSFDGIRELFNSLPVKLRQANNGRGVPIGYELSPLTSIGSACGLIERIDIICGRIADDMVEDISFAMEDSQKGILKLTEFLGWMETKSNHFSSRETGEVKTRLRAVRRARSKFMTEMSNLIKQFREECDEDIFEDIGAEIDRIEKDCSVTSMDNYICLTWGCRVKFVDFLDQQAMNNGVSVVPATDRSAFNKCVEKDQTFVLRIGCDVWSSTSPVTAAAIRVFNILQIKKKDRQLTTFVIVDCGNQPALNDAELSEYLHGNLVIEDVVTGMPGLMESKVWMDPDFTHSKISPECDLPLCIVCPRRCCSENFHRWLCSSCLKPIMYWYEGDVGCKECGTCPLVKCKFKCHENTHGPDFVVFDSSKQKVSLSREDDEVNLLFIGETRAGKSTTICSIANFFSFETLQDAMDNTDSLVVPIPIKFTAGGGGIRNGERMKAGEHVTVELGDNSDRNEFYEDGESATQNCKSYIINDFQRGKRIRLIDVPGIGDTRGLDQDKKNIDLIMTYIAQFTHIHGICMIMKANETRLTDSFGYCIMEILSRLHESAVKNVAFLFTYARTILVKRTRR